MVHADNIWSNEISAIEETEINLPQEPLEFDQAVEASAYHKRRTVGLWTAVASLAAALAVAACYGYSVINRENAQLAWLPGLMKSLSAVRGRMNALEADLQTWQGEQRRLADRLQQVDAAWKSGLNDTRQRTARLVSRSYEKLLGQLDQRTAALNLQLAQMASNQRMEQIRAARLEKELARAQQEIASVRANGAREFAALREQQTENRRQVSFLENQISSDQVDFEVAKDRAEEIVPGVSLHLTHTDTLRQSFEGWIWLAANRRTIWVRRQAVQSPVVFYPTAGGEAYELVVTRVNQNGAAGYLLTPRTSEAQQAALAFDAKSNTEATRFNY